MKRGKLRTVEGNRLMFWCPGCDGAHMIRVGDGSGPGWTFNGDYDRPTFSPSVLLRLPGAMEDGVRRPDFVCHSFVRDGRIEFLGDCTHALAGRTVPLPDFEEA